MSEDERASGVTPTAFREALASWASGVAIAAVREQGRVLGTTVTALLSVSVEPPLILISLGLSAQVLPFLAPGKRFGVSVLADHQARLASVFADAFPVGASPFPAEGDAVLPDALVRIGCRVERIDAAGDHRLVLARVERTAVGAGQPLLRYRRTYQRLPPD